MCDRVSTRMEGKRGGGTDEDVEVHFGRNEEGEEQVGVQRDSTCRTGGGEPD